MCDLAKSRLSFLTRNDKRVDSSSLKPVRHDTRFGDVYQCSSDKDAFSSFPRSMSSIYVATVVSSSFCMFLCSLRVCS